MNEGKCESCKYCSGETCFVPLFVNGDFTPSRETPAGGHCELYEEREKRT